MANRERRAGRDGLRHTNHLRESHHPLLEQGLGLALAADRLGNSPKFGRVPVATT